MSVQRDQERKRSIFRHPSIAPPPYSNPPTPTISLAPSFPPHLSSCAATPTPTHPQNCPETPSLNPLSPTDPGIETLIEQLTADYAQLGPSSPATDSPSPLSPPSPTTPILSPLRPTLSPHPHVDVVSPSQFRPASSSTHTTKSRSVFRPFSALRLKLSKAARNARAEREEEERRHAEAQAEARETVKSCIQSLLECGHPSEEDRQSLFLACSEACKDVGLELAVVLQEPLILKQTPVYWAILNRPATSSELDTATSDALIIALLNACRTLNETTIASVRLACMSKSNNALLQFLFREFPGLSPLSTEDRMLLRPSGGWDVVDVEETQDGTGAFIAHMKIRLFPTRMNVSTVVTVEFVTFKRIWMASFSAGTERTPGGSSESRVFSLELADNSMPAWVEADLRVSGHSEQGNTSDSIESTFFVPVACSGRALQPGPRNAIKVRLDDGPMGFHWVNKSQAFVDADETLHAQLNVRLTQPLSPVRSVGPDQYDTGSQVASSSVPRTQASSSHSDSPRPPASRSKGKRKSIDPNKPVFTSNRKGGHGR